MRKVLFILGGLSDLDVDWMIANGRREQVPRGSVLIEEGQPLSALYIVLDGLFRVSLRRSGNRGLARLGAGEIAGEISFIDGRVPSATVTVMEPGVVLSLPTLILKRKLAEDGGFAARFYCAMATFLADRLRQTDLRFGNDEQTTLLGREEAADELDMKTLDNVALAGARFDRMLKRLMGG
ncbi:MAG TPA: cyclic nucleotide-binding domain-containing protein [Verrucomicrobiae bacterium]|nr:cyclic nucleotide-binding domain-containing protein [Verrucomicrobiae bacterium]